MKSEKVRTVLWGLFGVLCILAPVFLVWSYQYVTRPAGVRSKASRVKADMRSLAGAIEAYYADNNSYPAWSVGLSTNAFRQTGFDDSNLRELVKKQPTFAIAPPGAPMRTMTTPIPYVAALPHDPFCEFRSQPYCYYRDKNSVQSMLWSAGPDGDYDLTIDNVVGLCQGYAGLPSAALLLYSWDPTNGTISSGDVFRCKS